jgi:hypothetical protein
MEEYRVAKATFIERVLAREVRGRSAAVDARRCW